MIKSQPQWFDAKCKLMKNLKYSYLRRYRRLKLNKYLILYLNQSQKFKSLCKNKQNAFYESIFNSLQSTIQKILQQMGITGPVTSVMSTVLKMSITIN